MFWLRTSLLLWSLILVSGPARADAAEPAKRQATEDRSAVKASSAVVPDLGTRKQGEDWTAFLGPTGDSKSRETGIIANWPREGPRIVWQQRVGVGYGMPAISRGRLFQFARFGKQARLECLQSETGAPVWKFEYQTAYEDMYGYDNGPRCSPIVDDDRVYIFGAEGTLHCLTVIDGKLLWKVDTKEKFGVVQNFFGVGSTPVIFDELLICQVGGSSEDSRDVAPGQLDRVQGKDSGVVAFDKRTGAVKYQISDELASYAGPVLARINDRPWCFVFARGGLLAFDPANGHIDFHFPWRAPVLESVNASNPVVVGDRVLISETYGPGGALLRVEPGKYELLWSDKDRRRDKHLQTHWNTPVHHEGYVYASSGRHSAEAQLRCLELETGKIMWSQPGLSRSSLLYVDGHFVVLTEGGDLLLIKATPEKFEPVSLAVLEAPPHAVEAPGVGPRKLLTYPAWAAPILSHGLLYVRGHDRLVCLELIPAQ
jgi:outer membrane protein assembly factor BamB